MRKHSNPKLNILMAAICAVMAAALVSPVTANATSHVSANLRDVPQDAWYADQVAALDREYDLFHFTTCSEGFCPYEPIKRNVMAVWTVRILDNEEPGSTTETRFDDVPTETTQDQYYAGFIDRLYELGVTTGCGDGSGFCPEDSVTRAQMAAFLTRAFDLPDGPPHGFDDIPEGAWYSDEVSALKASGITTGCGDNTGFCPDEPTTRAQMAVFLHRALNRSNTVATTSTTTVPATSDRIAPPLEKCSQSGTFGAGRVSVRIGFAGVHGADVYEAVAQGEPNSCEIIMDWWDAITQLEADRANRGEHPCEYPVPVSDAYDENNVQLSGALAEWNGPAFLVQCWPIVPRTSIQKLALKESNPDLYAGVLDIQTYQSFPPSSRPMLEAVWSCYRMALGGAKEYTTLMDCHNKLRWYGSSVRFGGVTDECAARMYIARVKEGIPTSNGLVVDSKGRYAGDYSWANCETTASKLIPAELANAPYTQRCKAMVDTAADTRTDTIAARGGGARADVVAVVKAMYCGGTEATVRQHAPKFQKYLPENWERDYWRAAEVVWGDRTNPDRSFASLAAWWSTNGDGTPCHEAALLVNAYHAVTEGTPVSKVMYC